MGWYGRSRWPAYVPVATRRRKAKKKMEALRKKGKNIQPIEIEGRKIAKTFWGKAWCDHLESFSDFDNRLPRGRTYVRNGSVCHLAISKGKIESKVIGSSLYSLRISIKTLSKKKWKDVKSRCDGQIGSLLELLQGKLSDGVMDVVTDPKNGLFPLPGEIKFDCDCPDWAVMCKHIAATLYGVGARLDDQPELLFLLRGVDHEELIDADAERAVSDATTRGSSKRLASDELSDVFGIDIQTDDNGSASKKKTTRRKKRPTKKTAKKKTAKKKTAKKKTAKKKTAKKTAKKKTAKKKTAKKKTAKKKTAKKKTAKKKTVIKKVVAERVDTPDRAKHITKKKSKRVEKKRATRKTT